MSKKVIMSKKMILMVMTLIFISFGAAYAEYIVDSGVPTASSATGLGRDWWIAGRFTVDSTTTVTDIQGYFSDANGGSLRAVIYSGGETVPNTAQEIGNYKFNVPSTGNFISDDWYGVSSINLSLSPGIYWIAFEVRSDCNYNGSMQDYPPSLLSHYASLETGNGSYYHTTGTYSSFGVRISGAQQQNEWLSGYVWDIDGGTKLTNAYVALYKLDGTLVQTYYTGWANGYYFFYQPSGYYYIRAYEASHGYTPYQLTPVPDYKIIYFP